MQKKVKISSILIVIVGLSIFSSQRGFSFGIEEEARLETPTVNPYSYLPMELRRPASRADKMRPSLQAVAPNRPAIITDADGFRSLYSSQGKLLAKLDPETGKTTYYIGNMPRFEKDKGGKTIRKYVYHSPRASIENEFGETIGYKSYGKGGLLLEEQDEKSRTTRRYEYNGRKLVASLDLLTNSRTTYNDRGKPDKEFNFQGAVIAQYYYNGGKLAHKIDNYGNKTVFSDDGKREIAAYDAEGNLIKRYEWSSGDSYKVTDQYGNTTFVVEERAQYVTNYAGTKTKSWLWQGTKLISSTDLFKEEITYYENGRPTETRYNGFLVGLWKYEEVTGILISYTDREGKSTYYDHGREAISITDPAFTLETFTRDYKPILFDEIKAIIIKYKDSSQSIMPEVERLLPSSQSAMPEANKTPQQPIAQSIASNVNNLLSPASQGVVPNGNRVSQPISQNIVPEANRTQQPTYQSITSNTNKAQQTASQDVVPNTNKAPQPTSQNVTPNTSGTPQPTLQNVTPEANKTQESVSQNVVPETDKSSQSSSQNAVPEVSEPLPPIPTDVIPEPTNPLPPAATPTNVVPDRDETPESPSQNVTPNTDNAPQPVSQGNNGQGNNNSNPPPLLPALVTGILNQDTQSNFFITRAGGQKVVLSVADDALTARLSSMVGQSVTLFGDSNAPDNNRNGNLDPDELNLLTTLWLWEIH